MHDTSVEIFEEKKKAIELGEEAFDAGTSGAKDIITASMKDNYLASEDDKLTDQEILGQISALIFAATDTTSSALSRIIYLLARHKDVQSKLREEIRNARKERDGLDHDHDSLISLPYLDAIIKETLRFYPPVVTTQRTARKDIILPLTTPIQGINGEEIREVPLAKGTTVVVSIIGSNRNPDIWGPDAHEWKPERWLHPLPESLIAAHVPGIYSHLMTFIAGGRSCVGFKFSQLEMKVVLSFLFEDLEFSPGCKEIIGK